MCPAVVHQHLHLVYQTEFARLLPTLLLPLPPLYPPVHDDALEPLCGNPSPNPVLPHACEDFIC